MDVRHQVFVSSTYTDLIEERREAMQALLELECIPAGMELFPAANDEQWELIKSVINQSDYYIVIIGGRYGSLSADGLSYTEREYDFAVAQGIPVAGFIFDKPGSLPRDKSDLDPKVWDQLEAFKEKVKTRLVKFYSDPVSLGGLVSRSMVAQIKRHPRPGWVRGELAMTAEVREELADLRAKLAERERDEVVAAAGVVGEPDSNLEQGDDEVLLGFRYFSTSWEEKRVMAGSLSISWDEIIEAVGPLMIDEATEPNIRKALDKWLLADLHSEPSFERLRAPSLSVDDASWSRVLVQLRALGYVELGQKKRTASDKAVYWRLTKRGDQRLVWLLASRREDEA